MLNSLGHALYRWRLIVLLAACALTFVAANSQSAQAQMLLDSRLNTGSVDVIILMSSPTLQVTDPAFTQAALQLIDRLKSRPEVHSITSYYSTHSADFISHDGHETLVLLQLTTKQSQEKSYAAIAPLITSSVLRLEVGGSIVADQQFSAQVSSDLAHAESVALPITLLLLVFIFGGLVAAILPLLLGGVAIALAFALLRILANFLDVSSFAINVTSFIGLGLAIDYSLFIVTRFREELIVDEADVQRALQRTMATAGRTILFSGLTVATSLIALLLFPEILLRSIGIAAIATALMSML